MYLCFKDGEDHLYPWLFFFLCVVFVMVAGQGRAGVYELCSSFFFFFFPPPLFFFIKKITFIFLSFGGGLV